jgi:hypothetical protein
MSDPLKVLDKLWKSYAGLIFLVGYIKLNNI